MINFSIIDKVDDVKCSANYSNQNNNITSNKNYAKKKDYYQAYHFTRP
jgi:hypothetical protein